MATNISIVTPPKTPTVNGAPIASARAPIGMAPSGCRPKVVMNRPVTRPHMCGGVTVNTRALFSGMKAVLAAQTGLC